MKYIQYISVMGIIAVLSSQQVLAADVTVIDVIDTNTLNFSLTEGVEFKQWVITGEIQVLQDMIVEKVTPSASDSKIVTISLVSPLQTETDYSILTVFGADGTIDFTTPSSIVPGKEFSNQAILLWEQTIEKVTIINNLTIEVLYTSEVTDIENLEYKLLGTLAIKSIEKKDMEWNRIYVSLSSSLLPSQDYILMIISLLDVNAADVDIESGIYDFTTPDMLENFDLTPEEDNTENIFLETFVPLEEEKDNTAAKLSVQEKIAAKNALKNDTSVAQSDIDEQMSDVSTWEEPDIELNAASEEEKFVETLIHEVSETPETGAETVILLLLTFIITGFYYSARGKLRVL